MISWSHWKSNHFEARVRVPGLFSPLHGCLNSPSLCITSLQQQSHHPRSPPSQPSPQHLSQKGLEPEMNHKHKERKMHKHMKGIKLPWKGVEFVFTLQDLTFGCANLQLPEKASGSSELLSHLANSWSLTLVCCICLLKTLRALQEEHFLSFLTTFVFERF